jgi:hypothetical protein
MMYGRMPVIAERNVAKLQAQPIGLPHGPDDRCPKEGGQCAADRKSLRDRHAQNGGGDRCRGMAPAGMMVVVRKLGGHGSCSG